MSEGNAVSNNPWSRVVSFLLANLNRILIGILILIIVVLSAILLSRRGGQDVSVTSFWPTGEAEQATNFSITFSRNVVSDSLLNVQLDEAAIRFDPPIPGKIRWIEPNKLRFYPDVLLAPSTQYTAEMLPRLLSRHGYRLKGKRDYTFHTPRFRVNSASLAFNYSQETNKTVSVFSSIEFNYEVDPEKAAKRISLVYPDGGEIDYQLRTTTPDRIVSLEATDVRRGKDESRIQLKVAEGLLPIGGNLALERDYVKPINIPGEQNLKVVRVVPQREGRANEYIQIQFNLPVNQQNADEFISVEPPVDYKLSASHYYLELRGDFKSDTTYQVALRKGLRAVDGSPLDQDFSTAISFRKENISPQVDFVGEGFYLTRGGDLNIGLSTINVDKVSLEVEKVYANNLVYLLNTTSLEGSRNYYGYYNLKALGKQVQSSDLPVQKVENEEVVTPISVRDYLSKDRKGIFKFTARMAEDRWNAASKWVVATDLGIVAKEAGSDLWVWINSLATLDPVQNVEVQLISQNNQALMNVRTDDKGLAIFQSYKKYTDEFSPYLITAAFGDDLSFLELQRRRIPTSDFEVGGEPYLEHGYEAFVYNERGVYRPGETAHLAAIVRGEDTSVPAPFPVRLRVTGPDRKILTEQRATLNAQGGVEFAVPVPDYVLTGSYLAALLIGEKEEIGRTSFNVEEFVPDRMKVKLTTDRESYRAGETMKIGVEAMTLFGPPAAGRQTQTQVEIEAFRFSPAKWRSFTFANDQKSFSLQKFDLGDKTLDDQGRYSYLFDIPKDLDPPSSLRGIISTTVLEPGGRGVSAYRSVIIHPHETYVGLRKAKEGYAAPNEPAAMEFIVLDPEEEPLAGRNIEVSCYRVYWHSILKKVATDGRYRYVSEKVEDLVRKFNVTSENGTGRFDVTPENYGRYRVVAKDVGSGATSSIGFYASGWGYSPWAMDHPDRIELDLDKEVYKPGETAKIQVRAPFSGKLLLTVERDKIFDHKIVTMQENTATLEVPVTRGYKPNVYVSAHLIRSTESLDRDTPARAFGVVPLKVDTHSNVLAVDLKTPEEIRPQSKLKVEFQVTGSQHGPPFVTIAAVDEGICQLTDFQTPDPHGYYFGKKRLSVESYDIYGMVLPNVESALTSTSGDVEAARKKHLMPVSVTRVKPVAFWSGLLETNKDGRGEVSFDIPQFNGSIRVMAVAFAGDRFGQTQKNVFVREPIVLTSTFPRFISSGDALTVSVNVYNGTGGENPITVKLAAAGPVNITSQASQTVQVAKGAESVLYFDLKAENTTGKVTFRVAAEGGGASTEESVDVAVRPPVPYTTLTGSGSVTQTRPATFTFPSDWLKGTAKFGLTVSPFPTVKFARSLQYLLEYPYGCVEQTTSKVFPLLYFNEIARVAEPELFNRNGADYFVEEGIAKLENMQLISGAFSYWPTGGYVNNWSSVYAAHFLVEARKAGYTVSDRVYDRLISALQNFNRNYRSDDVYSYQMAVYACYVLALAGKPDRSTMLYFKNSALDKLADYSKFQLAGAFAFSGDLQTALTLLPQQVEPVQTTDAKRQTGVNFNSPIRAKAIMLSVLADVDERNPMVPVLVSELTEAASKQGRWYNTQENAFAFLALGKILTKQQPEKYTGSVSIAGKTYSQFNAVNQRFTEEEWGGKEVSVRIEGGGTCYYYWRAEGIPASLNVEEYDHDLMVRRRYLDENGRPIDYSKFKQGELIIAEITIKPLFEALDNVAIVDMLPAGLEIENPRLQSRQGISWIGKNAYTPMYMDIRDDRMLLFGNFRPGREAKFYYGLRAVTRGKFILPPVRAEAMYAPGKASVASSGEIVVNGL